MLEYLEGVQFLRSGMGDYPEDKNRQDPFSFGGFAKVQPYYARVAEVHALRDDVKPFVRSYFNALAAHDQPGEPVVLGALPQSGGLEQDSRDRLVPLPDKDDAGAGARGGPLAGPDGDRSLASRRTCISVRNAPTRFGKVSYTIRSATPSGRIDAEIQPPSPSMELRSIVLRLRHPDGKPIRGVTVQGQPHHAFDAKAQTITLKPGVDLRSRCEWISDTFESQTLERISP